MDLGATPVRVFFDITLPIIAPALVSGWLLAFTLSLDDLVIASFTSGPGATTLPMRIYSQVRLGVSPEINAVCTLLIGVVALGHAEDAGQDDVELDLSLHHMQRAGDRLAHGQGGEIHRVAGPALLDPGLAAAGQL
eukprot:gene32752-33540_t